MTRTPLVQGRRRTVLQVLLVALAVTLVLWAGDTVARFGAETLLAKSIEDATGAAEPPEVHVRGAFFVPQVIRGAYTEVDVTTRGVTSGPLRVDRVSSTLTDVRLPFHDVLVQDIRAVGIAQSDEQASLLYSDLNAYLTATGRSVQVGAGPDGTVRVTGSVTVLDQTVSVTSDASMVVADGQLSLVPQTIDTGGTTVGEATRLLLAQRLRLVIPLGTLPFGHQLTDARAGSTGIVITAVGRGIVLRP